MLVPRNMWEYLPPGAFIRYTNKGTAPAHERFRGGGFIKGHFDTADHAYIIMLEPKLGGKRGDNGYHTTWLVCDEAENIWKKYDQTVFVETHIMLSTISQQAARIADLEKKHDQLARMVSGLGTTMLAQQTAQRDGLKTGR